MSLMCPVARHVSCPKLAHGAHGCAGDTWLDLTRSSCCCMVIIGYPDWSSNGHGLDGLAMLGSTLYWKLVWFHRLQRARNWIFWTQTSFIQVAAEGLQSPTGYLKSWSFWWCEHLWIGPHFDDLRCKVCIHFLLQPVGMDILPKSTRTKASLRCVLHLTHIR